MTTDTFPKGAYAEAEIDGVTVRIAGIAKGSGMIAPDMATMLAFVVTDAAISPAALQTLVSALHPQHLQRGDGGRRPLDQRHPAAVRHRPVRRAEDQPGRRPRAWPTSATSWRRVLLDLAQQLVRDGEGATKFVKITVTGAESAASARKIARTVAESPLVKTAFAGEDANWGRIVMAVGRADEPVNRDRMSVKFGDLWAAQDGLVSPDLRRGQDERLHEEAGAGGQRRRRRRPRLGRHLDLRPDQALRRDQRRLPLLRPR